jgi:hypothetical protein
LDLSIRQLLRRQRVLLHVVEAAAVHRPLLAADALVEGLLVLRLLEAVVQHHEVEGGADPRDGGDDVDPAQQQIGPVEVVAFHVLNLGLDCSPLRAL